MNTTTRAALALAATTALVGCAPSAPARTPSAASESLEELISADGPLLIPVRFVHMVKPCAGAGCSPCTTGTHLCSAPVTPFEDLEGRVAQANLVFGAARLRFYVERVDVLAMPHFHDLAADEELEWATVRPELKQLLPRMEEDAFAESEVAAPVFWLANASAHAQPANEILVVIAEQATQAWGFYPQEGRIMIQTPGNLGSGTWNFSHELGHYLGLPHSFGAPWNMHQWDLKPGYLLNPSTQRPIVLSDFWDLVYKPGNPAVFYDSKEAAAKDEALLRTVDGTQTVEQCAGGVRCCTSHCSVRCNLDGDVASHEHLAEAGGNAFTIRETDPPRKRRGPNLMSYMAGGPNQGCRVGLSRSQLLQVRRVLHYDVPNVSFPGLTGGRPQLGRGKEPNPVVVPTEWKTPAAAERSAP